MEGGKRKQLKKRKRADAEREVEQLKNCLTELDKMMLQFIVEEELGRIEDPVGRSNRILNIWRLMERALDNGKPAHRAFKMRRTSTVVCDPVTSVEIPDSVLVLPVPPEEPKTLDEMKQVMVDSGHQI